MLVLAACAPPFDPVRVGADPGTFGTRVVTLMCKRLAFQADPTDVSGDRFRETCKGGPLVDGAPPTIVAITQQRATLIAAIDAIVPEESQDALQAYLTSDAVLALYDDDTMSTAIASLGDMLAEIGDDPDALAVFARQGLREGYRPARAAVGPAGPLTGSPYIRDVLGQVLPTIVDGGDAHAEWTALVAAISETLRDAEAPSDAASPDRAAALAQSLLLSDYPELAEAQPLTMVRRDTHGEAMVAPSGIMRFDLDRTLLGALAHDQAALMDQGTAFDLLRGSSLLLGDRAPKVRTFTSGRTLEYTGYEGDAPLLDLSYAFAQLLRDPNADDTLALGEILFRDHEAVTARLIEAAITAARAGDAHPEAQILPDAPLWDDLLPLVQRITADPQLVRALIVALQRPEVRPLIQRFREFMAYKDRFDIGSAQQLVGAFTTAPDRTQPDAGYNRSLFQRLLQVISDSNGAVECSKAGAQIKDPLLGVPLHTFANACDFYRIPNMAVFYLQSIAYAKDANGNVICEDASGEFGTTRTASTGAGCTAMGGTWHPRRKANFNYQWPLAVRPLVAAQGGDAFLAQQSTIAGFGTHPTPEALNRVLFLVPRPQSLNDVSDPSRDKFGALMTEKHAGTLPVWEMNNFYDEMRPIVQAFADANQEQTFVDLMSVLNKHWPSDGSNLVSWEPMLDEIFAGDLWPALTESATELDSISAGGKPLATVLAHAGAFLTTPLPGLADRRGRTTTTGSDGRAVSTLAPFHLLADAELAKRARLAASAAGTAWTESMPEIVDLWFRGEATTNGWRFRSRHASAVVRGVIALVRNRLAAHAGDRITWLSTTLPQKVEDTFTHPVFAALADFIDVQSRLGSRIALERLLADVLDPAQPDVFDTMRVGAADLLQLASDDDDLVPLARLAGRLLDNTYLPTQLALLSRLHAADVDATLTAVVKRLFMPNDPDAPGVPAIAHIIDGTGEVDRTEPGIATPWSPADYGSVFHGIAGFLHEEKRGMPRFITIVKGRSLP